MIMVDSYIKQKNGMNKLETPLETTSHLYYEPLNYTVMQTHLGGSMH